MNELDATTGAADASVHLQRAWRIDLVDERIRGLLMSGGMAAVYYSPRGQEVLAAAMAENLIKAAAKS